MGRQIAEIAENQRALNIFRDSKEKNCSLVWVVEFIEEWEKVTNTIRWQSTENQRAVKLYRELRGKDSRLTLGWLTEFIEEWEKVTNDIRGVKIAK